MHTFRSVFKFIAALLYDCLAILSLFFAFTTLCLLARHQQAIAPHTLWYQISLLSIAVAYFLGSLINGGQTLGMRAWQLYYKN